MAILISDKNRFQIDKRVTLSIDKRDKNHISNWYKGQFKYTTTPKNRALKCMNTILLEFKGNIENLQYQMIILSFSQLSKELFTKKNY